MSILEQEAVKIGVEGPISSLIINRPQSLNSLVPDVLHSLILAIDKLEKNPDLRVITIRGEGDKSFVAGADIPHMSQLGPRAIADYAELGQRAMRRIENARVPVIAVINGYALGGGLELALACDILIASERAKLGQPEVNLGIIPGFGGTQRLALRCGIGAARRLILGGEVIHASEALSLGLVDKVVAPENLDAEAQKFAELIATKAPLAVRGAKKVLRQSVEPQLLSGLRLEVETFLELFASVDREEGMKAFLQKREPKFTGR